MAILPFAGNDVWKAVKKINERLKAAGISGALLLGQHCRALPRVIHQYEYFTLILRSRLQTESCQQGPAKRDLLDPRVRGLFQDPYWNRK